ncbi:MAG TPA: UvrD-helicase domain-containing protein, partial [Kofleriaceae bacterium]|nr:UvrD-helicase domain-containing protein [Kofleriaceae bacterium]
IATIHGFADHLLRKWPAQARLDPRYQLVDDDADLADECFQVLVHAAETRTLGELLRGSDAAGRADEAIATILDLPRAGLRLRSLETEYWTYHGLDNLVAGFVLHRDIVAPELEAAPWDRAAFERVANEYLQLVEGLSPKTRGGRWLVETAALLRTMVGEPDPVVIYRELVERLERGPSGRASDSPRRGQDFAGDDRAWDAWKAFDGDERRKPVRPRPLRDDLLAPLRRWLAIRLSRLGPVVRSAYELVKARHQAVDHIDLLLRLRDLLRDDRAIRQACQGLFDHIFVDEFQDTDPLQAEILLFLCERGAEAATWDAVTLAPGKLTLVGDPKQSIYRFRRADIATYQRVVEIVERSPHRSVRLSSSFRSAPGLVDWLNARFAEILGVPERGERGERFRPDTGEVFHHPLAKGRASGSEPAVHAVPIDLPEGGSAAELRALEAEAMARYLRWLVRVSGVRIVDPVTGEPRSIGFGDIGVLAITTTNVPVLFEAFDRDDVPYAGRGGALFLGDPTHRQFLLGLSALADRDDGVALAALLRPPFFAVDLGDLARSRTDDPDDRAVQARAIVRALRRRRFERSPGATARALLEDTAIGRTIALGPNGRQRLSGLRELCFQIEARALAEQLDFDAIMERVRGWIDHPQALDRPHPVTGDVVRVMTIHQAKGLEFPVVVLWDGRAGWKERMTYDAWTMERDGRGWAMRLDLLHWEEPAGLEIARRERLMREAERKRLVYVAATRARDILVIPKIGTPDERWIFGRLLGSTRSPAVVERERHTPDRHAGWFDAATPATIAPPAEVTDRDAELARIWTERASEASRRRLPPSSFTQAALPRLGWGKKGRFGSVFGDTVHLAIGLVLQADKAVEEAVRSAAARTALLAHLAEAVEDVARALATLRALGVSAGEGAYRLEYPIAGLAANGDLVAGYVDLVIERAEGLIVLDFKTDVPPEADQLIVQKYLDQVRGYVGVLAHSLGAGPIRAGFLFTADGGIRWLPSDSHAHSSPQPRPQPRAIRPLGRWARRST